MGEIARHIEHFAETAADRGTRMIGTKRGLPFERAQQLLSDRMVVRMAQRAQASRIQRLGSPVNPAQQIVPPKSPNKSPKSAKLSPPPPVVP